MTVRVKKHYNEILKDSNRIDERISLDNDIFDVATKKTNVMMMETNVEETIEENREERHLLVKENSEKSSGIQNRWEKSKNDEKTITQREEKKQTMK